MNTTVATAAPLLAGRVALVLGANGGIGSAIARRLGAAGARVILAARDGERLAALRDELIELGIPASSHPVDVSDADALGAVITAVTADGLDIAVNNVGVSHRPTPLPDLALSEFDRVIAVTLRGVAVAMMHELRNIRPSGAIVNIASSAGLDGAPGMSAYVAAKHGVIGLTKTAAIDSAARGVRVNAVAPGPIASGTVMAQGADVRARIGGFVPLGRMGTGEEVAEAVLWLASPLASFTTGSVVAVDGGKRA